MTSGPPKTASQGDRPQAAIGAALADLVARTPDVRLWVQPPFDRLPARPGQPPPGITVEPSDIHIHLAASTIDLVPVTTDLGQAAATIASGHDLGDVRIHLHIDQLEGAPLN